METGPLPVDLSDSMLATLRMKDGMQSTRRGARKREICGLLRGRRPFPRILGQQDRGFPGFGGKQTTESLLYRIISGLLSIGKLKYSSADSCASKHSSQGSEDPLSDAVDFNLFHASE